MTRISERTNSEVPPLTLRFPLAAGWGASWRSRLVMQVTALGIRMALWLGFLVVVVGVCRSGKTALLVRALPGRVVNLKEDVLAAASIGQRPSLRQTKIPAGTFAIDEFEALDPRTIEQDLNELLERAFAISVQSSAGLAQLGAQKWMAGRRRIEITLGCQG